MQSLVTVQKPACSRLALFLSPIFLLSYGDLSKFTHALIEKTDLMTL